jgi:aromatic ring-cleaving dioxygenase
MRMDPMSVPSMREFATAVEASSNNAPASLSARIRAMTAELRDLEKSMKAEREAGNAPMLFEFRTALDNARMTAWVMSELANVHQTRIDPHAISAYLTSERIRRFGQLVKDICADLETDQISAHTMGITQLQEALNQLEARLSRTSKT